MAFHVHRSAALPFVRPILLGAAILSPILCWTSAARADALDTLSGNADDAFSPEFSNSPTGNSPITNLRDLNFPLQAACVNPISFSDSSFLDPRTDLQTPDPRISANRQAGSQSSEDTPYLIEAFLGDQPFDSWAGMPGRSPSCYGFYDDSFNAMQIKSMGAGTGPSHLIDNIEMTTLGSTVPEPNTLLLVSSAMLVLGVVLRCIFARD